jgi:hypothetical protein
MGNPSMDSFRRIKMQYVALVGGVAIAVAAAIGVMSIEGDSKAAPRSSITPAPAARSSVADTPRLVFYVVESEAAKARFEAMIAADEQARIEAGGPERLFLQILVADSAEAEAAAMHTIFNANAEATEFGTFTVDFVDLRPDLIPVD